MQTELEFEQGIIKFLTEIGGSKQWQYVSKIKTNDQLWDNFKTILERNNQNVLSEPLNSNEFAQVKQQIINLETPYQAGKFLYGYNGVSQVEVDLDNGKHVFLTVFDQDQVGAGNTVYQVVNQIERPPKVSGYKSRRFDTTMLINGLPIIQIEEKKASHDAKEALRQMEQYINENQYSDIFATVQILVGITPDNALYMANTTKDKFNTDFAFHWQREEDNRPIHEWRDFANRMLSIPMAHQMATSYMILDGTKNRQMLKVMRSYQVYATRRIIDKLKTATFDYSGQKIGYIWHTTGSGKTISSFKAAWLASRLPNVDKVIFLVDRVALTQQTVDNYSAYDPDGDDEKGGVVTDTTSVNVLSHKIRNKNGGIIVTSIQKMDRLVQRKSFKKPDKHIVFIVDEAHRSTSGEMLQRTKEAFPHSAWVGYTGTPNFDGVTTQNVFGDLLHAYTIREAIADHNVLGFKVDFNTTLSEKTLKKDYLPAFYHQNFPKWTDEAIDYKIDHLSREDMDDMVNSSVYDDNEEHVKLVVDDILTKWRNRSVNYRYSAMLTTHVGGGKASSKMAMMYFDEFQRQNLTLEHPLKVAVTFSQDNSNGKNMLNTNQGLHRAMEAYNAVFGSNFDDDDVKAYTESVVSRLNRSVDDDNYLDLVIVIDQLLTGFDAPFLNTLYVDRTMSGAGLIQAYSRTNRIQNMQQKPYGRIVNYRWPAMEEKLMNEALTVYANRASANIQLTFDGGDSSVIVPSYEKIVAETNNVVQKLAGISDGFSNVPEGHNDQVQMLHLLKEYNSKISMLKQDDRFDYNQPDELLKTIGITVDQENKLTTTLKNELLDSLSKYGPDKEDINQLSLDLDMEHVTEVRVDYDYLEELVAKLANEMNAGETAAAHDTYAKVNDEADRLENRHYAKQVKRMAESLLNQDETITVVSHYPVATRDVKQLIANHAEQSKRGAMLDFRKQWGLVDTEHGKALMNKIFDRHVTGNDDLNENNELATIINEGQRYYKTDATNEKVSRLSKIKYRNQLREQIIKFADEVNQEF